MGGTIKAGMKGATAEFRARITKVADDATEKEIIGFAQTIIRGLPETKRLGSLQAALMLAAHAFGEYGAAAAVALVQEERLRQREGDAYPAKTLERAKRGK